MSKIKFIAEIGLNHNGNKDLIFELIRNASFCGVDYVKFQLGWRGKVDEMNHFDSKILESIYNFGELYNVEILFSVFDNASLDLLLPFKPKLIKIASRTLKNDIELVKKIHNQGINTLSSVGMIDLNNIPDLNRFLFCKSKYPTYKNDLTDFPENFLKSKFVGYSDHCLGIANCLIAISRGAEIIEKHFTLDKSDTTIRDHTLSATPSELSDLVKYGREIAIYSK